MSQHAIASAFVIAGLWSTAALPAQCPVRWESSDSVMVAGARRAYVERPAMFVSESSVVLVGQPAVAWAERDAFDPPPGPRHADTVAYFARLRTNIGFSGFAIDSTGSARSLPWTPPSPVHLPAGISSNGASYLVWMSPSADSAYGGDDRSLWFAVNRNGTWSNAELLYSADALGWGGDPPSVIAAGDDIHILVRYYRGQHVGIAYVRRTAGTWHTTEVPLGDLPSQVSAQLIGRDSLIVAYAGVGSPEVRVRNGQHVFVIRAAVTDSAWPAARRIQWSGLNAVGWVHVYSFKASRDSSTLAVLWARRPQEAPGASDSLFAMTTRDHGATWTPASALALSTPASDLTQAQTADGTVHVVLTPARQGGPRVTGLDYTTFLPGAGWQPTVRVVAAEVASSARLAAFGTDLVVLAWGEARPASSADSRPAPMTRIATGHAICANHGARARAP